MHTPDQSQYGISVLMPVCNGGKYLQEAVGSILRQRDVLLELLLIDDHSTDDAIRSLLPDDRLVIIKSPQKGIVPALNTGIRYAKYPYIARMDADDIAEPDRLITQLKYLLKNPSIDLCGTLVELFCYNRPVGEGYQRYQQWINKLITPEQIARNFFIESCIPHPTLLTKTDLLRELGGYQDSPWPEDYDLWCRAYLAGKRFGKPDGKPLLKWRDYGERTSRTDSRYSKQAFLKCKAFYLSRYLKARDTSQIEIWGTGPTGLKLHDYLLDNGITTKRFVDINPKMVGRKKRDKEVYVISAQTQKTELSKIDSLLVVAVSSRGARDDIRTALLQADLVELTDFILAA